MKKSIFLALFLCVCLACRAGGPSLPGTGGTGGGTTDTATITAAIASAARTDLANTFTATQTIHAIGIGTNTPAVPFHNEGFSMLGDSSPHIKIKQYTGTTSSSETGAVTVAHGLASASVILGAIGMVKYSDGGNYVTTSYGASTDHEWTIGVSTESIQIVNYGSAIVSKPFRILVFYTDTDL